MALKRVVLLVGGVGGAKLAYGLTQMLPPEQLTVVVNTGDDFWHYGLRICPDLDTMLYTLGGVVDKHNGWGVGNDTIQVLNALARYGEEPWFRLGDADMATHVLRTQWLRDGDTLTTVMARLADKHGVQHPLLPMSNEPVETVVDTAEHGRLPFQVYFVRHRWQPTVRALDYTGAAQARLSPQVAEALADADAIILGPSNPWLSLGPMLAVPGMRDALLARDVPRVAVSPIVDGNAIKGPTAKIMAELGLPVNAASVAAYYGPLVNGFVYDGRDGAFAVAGVRATAFDTVMKSDRDKIVLAEQVLRWVEGWA